MSKNTLAFRIAGRGNESPGGSVISSEHNIPVALMNRRRFLTVAALATGALAGVPAWAQESAGMFRLTFGKAVTTSVAGTEINPEKPWQPSQEENLASKDGRVQMEMEPACGAALFFKNRF